MINETNKRRNKQNKHEKMKNWKMEKRRHFPVGPVLGVPGTWTSAGRMVWSVVQGPRRCSATVGGRSGALLIPNIPVGGGVRAFFGAGRHFDPHRTLPETLLCDHSLNWCENLAQIHHMTKLQQACDMKANVRFRGAPNAATISAKKEWTRKARKFRSHLQWLTEVRRRVTDTETDTVADMVLSQGGTSISSQVQ